MSNLYNRIDTIGPIVLSHTHIPQFFVHIVSLYLGYIPSHWFHYITSLQKSAQCNTRSGQYKEGSPEFGGYDDVTECKL